MRISITKTNGRKAYRLKVGPLTTFKISVQSGAVFLKKYEVIYNNNKQGDTRQHQPGVANTSRTLTTISPGQLAAMDSYIGLLGLISMA